MPTPAVSALSTPPDDAPAAYPPRRVYSVVGVPPEIQAYALAKYSRSSQGMLETIQELSAQKAEQFLTTFYFQYGHRSIADLAHIALAVERLSILAAIELAESGKWVRIVSIKKHYRHQLSNKTFEQVPPKFTDRKFTDLIDVAFKDRIVSSLE